MRIALLLLSCWGLLAVVSGSYSQTLILSEAEHRVLGRADAHVRAGEFAEAIPLLERFVERHEVSPLSAHLLLVRALDGEGRLQDALKAAFRAEAQHPKSTALALQIAEMLMRGGEAPFTTRHYLEIASGAPIQSEEAKLLYGEWAYRRADFALAIRKFEEAATASRGANAASLRAITWVARCYAADGDAVKAEETFRAALEMNSRLGALDEEQAMHYVRFLEAQQRHREAQALEREIEARMAARRNIAPVTQLNGEPQRLQ